MVENKYFGFKILLTQLTLLFFLSSVYAQNDTLKVFNFEFCTVSFIAMDGFKHIVFENDTLNTVLFKETDEPGSELDDLKDVKVGDNCTVGIFVRKGLITTYTLLSLEDKDFRIANFGWYEFDQIHHNFKVSMLSYNSVFKESFESDMKNEIQIYSEDGFIQNFKGGKPFMNRSIANQRKRVKK